MAEIDLNSALNSQPAAPRDLSKTPDPLEGTQNLELANKQETKTTAEALKSGSVEDTLKALEELGLDDPDFEDDLKEIFRDYQKGDSSSESEIQVLISEANKLSEEEIDKISDAMLKSYLQNIKKETQKLSTNRQEKAQSGYKDLANPDYQEFTLTPEMDQLIRDADPLSEDNPAERPMLLELRIQFAIALIEANPDKFPEKEGEIHARIPKELAPKLLSHTLKINTNGSTETAEWDIFESLGKKVDTRILKKFEDAGMDLTHLDEGPRYEKGPGSKNRVAHGGVGEVAYALRIQKNQNGQYEEYPVVEKKIDGRPPGKSGIVNYVNKINPNPNVLATTKSEVKMAQLIQTRAQEQGLYIPIPTHHALVETEGKDGVLTQSVFMDPIQGKDLYDELDTLSQEDRRAIAAELLTVFQNLHKTGIAYRDIKPENIKVRRSPNGVLLGITLIDFGFATTDKISTEAVGTPDYVDPSVPIGEYNPQFADEYSLGILFLLLLTPGPTITQMKKIFPGKNPSLSHYSPAIESLKTHPEFKDFHPLISNLVLSQDEKKHASKQTLATSTPSTFNVKTPKQVPAKALFDFQAEDSTELSCNRGEQLTASLYHPNSNHHWTWAKNAKGEEGIIAANYIKIE